MKTGEVYQIDIPQNIIDNPSKYECNIRRTYTAYKKDNKLVKKNYIVMRDGSTSFPLFLNKSKAVFISGDTNRTLYIIELGGPAKEFVNDIPKTVHFNWRLGCLIRADAKYRKRVGKIYDIRKLTKNMRPPFNALYEFIKSQTGTCIENINLKKIHTTEHLVEIVRRFIPIMDKKDIARATLRYWLSVSFPLSKYEAPLHCGGCDTYYENKIITEQAMITETGTSFKCRNCGQKYTLAFSEGKLKFF